MTEFVDNFSEEIWNSTYRYRPTDDDVDGTFRRVADALASAEKEEEREKWATVFADALADFKVMMGGRIYANAGTGYEGTTWINCFVGPKAVYDVDSLEEIINEVKRQSLTLKSEGGWGNSFDTIRPRGSMINGIGVETPGAVKYMEIYDKVSDIITSSSGVQKEATGKAKKKNKIRKGAMMSVLSCFGYSVEILTNKGYIKIGQLCEERDDTLLAVTENGEKFPIVDWIVNPPAQLYEIEDECGNVVEVTADHKFVVYNTETHEEYLCPLRDINPEVELLVRMTQE